MLGRLRGGSMLSESTKPECTEGSPVNLPSSRSITRGADELPPDRPE